MSGESAGAAARPRSGLQPVSIVFVVAVADNGVIGRNGQLPWRLKSEMQHFRALTMGKPVVMGRKTFLSIGKPLTGRTNIVVSGDPTLTVAGAVVAPNLPSALASARGDALRRASDSIMVIGGAEIFMQAMPLADRLELTQVHAAPEGDVKLAPVDPRQWRETFRKDCPAGPGDDADYTILTYVRAGEARAS